MLQKLYIKHFAIIEELQMEWANGLIALTGETGAGKSIILGSIQLLLGARADIGVIYKNADKCIVEGEFSVLENHAVKQFLIENDLELSDVIIVRREIMASGRSRAFICDTPVNLTVLQNLGELLIDLHRQFDNVEMRNGASQLHLLDQLAMHDDLLLQHKNIFTEYTLCNKKLNQLKNDQAQHQKAYDYNQFQLQELSNYSFKENEIEDAELQLKTLSNAEVLKASLQLSIDILQDGENAIGVQLKQIINALQQASSGLPDVAALITRLEQSRAELKDIAYEINNLQDNVEMNPEQLSILENRYNEGTRLLKKHNVNSTNELLAVQAQFENALLQNDNLVIAIQKQEQLLEELNEKLVIEQQQLTLSRTKAALETQHKVNLLLPNVGMPNAQIKIDIQATAATEAGVDMVSFLIDANKTGNFASIGKIASGGELSRLMLCVKSLLASKRHLPTLIFDEIDTGISGETARQVGLLMQQLSQQHQLIVVTHLPQIAAKASIHLHVYKAAQKDGQLSTSIKILSNKERLNQIAEMLSGSQPTAAALKAAGELIAQ